MSVIGVKAAEVGINATSRIGTKGASAVERFGANVADTGLSKATSVASAGTASRNGVNDLTPLGFL